MRKRVRRVRPPFKIRSSSHVEEVLFPATLIILLVGLVGLGLVLYAWRLPPFTSSVETTDNAYVRGYVTTLSRRSAVT